MNTTVYPNKAEIRVGLALTKKAEKKVKEILSQQPESYAGLRIQVVAGGCSGFQYRMRFDANYNDQADAIFEFDGLKVFVDKTSLLYMDGVEVDYVERLHDAGFKFSNPNASGSCGCGSSFSV
jgi:iron-sulfur cluster assembly accessory protein